MTDPDLTDQTIDTVLGDKTMPDHKTTSAWYECTEHKIRVYLRLRAAPTPRITVANVTSASKGVGNYSRFLQWLESKAEVFIENVHEPQQFSFYERRGYQKLEIGYCMCFLKQFCK